MKQKLLLFFLFILASCNSIKYSETDKGTWRPTNSNVFSYKKHNFHLDNNSLDTNKIYCFAYPIDTPKYFECYRFFANGRLLSYRFFDHIDTLLLSNINSGGVGYFHIRDNIIRIQEFTVFAEHFKEGGGGRLIHHYGIISNDCISLDMGHYFSKRYFFKPKLKGILSAKKSFYTKYQKTNIEVPNLRTNW